MTDNIISYIEMCRREGLSLQAGMNFDVGHTHSVILMSVRPTAPYRDRVEDGGTTLVYEGYDQPRSPTLPNPKLADQLERLPTGSLTQNGKFHRAAQEVKAGRRRPERVRVYEKIRPGIWSDNGIFHLVDSWTERDEYRLVYKFRLEAVEGEEDLSQPAPERRAPRRIIPTAVKLEVREDREVPRKARAAMLYLAPSTKLPKASFFGASKTTFRGPQAIRKCGSILTFKGSTCDSKRITVTPLRT